MFNLQEAIKRRNDRIAELHEKRAKEEKAPKKGRWRKKKEETKKE